MTAVTVSPLAVCGYFDSQGIDMRMPTLEYSFKYAPTLIQALSGGVYGFLLAFNENKKEAAKWALIGAGLGAFVGYAASITSYTLGYMIGSMVK